MTIVFFVVNKNPRNPRNPRFQFSVVVEVFQELADDIVVLIFR